MIRVSAINKYVMCFLICAVMLVGSGCRLPWLKQPQSVPVKSEPQPVAPHLVKQYRQAVTAYLAQEYAVAAKRFQSVQRQAGDGDMARYALFGLACTRLMEAETPGQYQGALALWESWMKKAPTDFKEENPMLWAPLVKEKMLFSNIPLTSDGRGDIKASPKVSQWIVINASKEIKRLRHKIELEDRSNRKLREQIVLLEKKMGKLKKQNKAFKKQIKALETIDQKIQQKKHSIPSTDSTTPR